MSAVSLRFKIWAIFGVLTLIWGASFLWIKIAVEDIGPYSLVCWRLLFGLLGLVPFFIIQRPSLQRGRRRWLDLCILGMLNTAAPWYLISSAEVYIDSALATVLNGTVPLFTIIFAQMFLHDDRVTTPRVMGLLLGFVGVVVLTQRGGDGAAGDGPGLWPLAAMLLATACYAASGVFARRRLRNASVLDQSFYSMAFGAVVMWGGAMLFNHGVAVPSESITWIALVWLGVLGAGLASYMFFFLLHAIGPTRASVITYTIPVVGVALGVLVLNERLDIYLILGTVLIVSGLWIVNRRARVTTREMIE